MDEFKLPRSTLDKLPTALLKGVMIALLENADENGVLTISIREFARKIRLEYQPLRTALKHIYANAIANAIATQRLTQITINDIESYSTPARKQQRKANATLNATIDNPKTLKFSPPTEQEAIDFINEKGYHFNPSEFVSWNQSKGWKIGTQPMKDWKAACRTWEIRWKEKYGEQFYYQIGANHNASNKQKDRYSALESATETVLRQPDNLDSYFND